MRKIFLSVFGFALICRQHAFSQIIPDTGKNKTAFEWHKAPPEPGSQDTTGYVSRRLRIDEIDLVSSYYKQNGDHSAVTGGIGTEKVTDFSNGLNLNLVWLNQSLNKNTLSAGFGFDHQSSASSSYVALKGGANPAGTRMYPSLDWTVENSKKGSSFGIGAYYSGEYNYKSKGADLHWTKKTNDKNGEFGVKLQGYVDRVTLIYPSEFVPAPIYTVIPPGSTIVTSASGNTRVVTTAGKVISNTKSTLPTSGRNTFTASFSYSQMLTSRLQVMFLGDVVTQSGYLGLPFHRVYFSNGKDTIEHLPSSRFKLPLGFRLNYFIGDNVIIRTYYRYYTDNWGTRSNTVNLEIPVKITPFFSVSPFYRYYDQSASKYFAPYEQHSPTDQYFTSNYEYAKFKSGFYGVGFRMAPPKGVFGWQGLHELEIRYGHYTQTTNLASDVVSLSLAFK